MSEGHDDLGFRVDVTYVLADDDAGFCAALVAVQGVPVLGVPQVGRGVVP